jgi:Transposase DDE domain group 1
MEGFQVNARVREKLARRKRRIQKRLDKGDLRGCSQPMFTAANIHYEIGERGRGIAYGGIGAMKLLVQKLALAEAIDERLHLLKIHLPYHESDHVLNIAYNALCDATCLQDIELRRNDEVFLDALGARRIPDPTTAGDFCRRFTLADVHTLLDIFNDMRLKVWAGQPQEFFAQACLDLDGTLVETAGECKQGMDIAYNGTWGYHPLVVSLANTGEVLSVINRSGNRPSHEGAAAEVDRALQVCFRGGFQQVLVRGDTDFTQTTQLDRWDDDPRVRFIFGAKAMPNLEVLADDLPRGAWQHLVRPPRYEVQTETRQRPENVKEGIVVARAFENIRLLSEDVAEIDYRPTVCDKSYRLIVVRKNLSVEKGETVLFADYRYFFYLTNDRVSLAADIVFSANDRCDQENLHAQLKNGVCALQAPLDNLVSNWAYMVMTTLAWNMKAWLALQLPEQPGRWQQRHQSEKHQLLKMEFKTFVNALLRMPCQILRSGRKLVYRLLSWNPWLSVFFRLLDVLRC